jgi:hypothetical protein
MRVSMKEAGLALVTALSAMLPAGSAHAASAGGIATISVGNCGQFYGQYCTGYGQGVPVGLSTLTVAITCSANTPFVVDRTGVGCYLVGLTDGRTYLSTGPLFTAGNTSEIANEGAVPFQGYRLCVGAGYSTTSGAFQPVQNYHCE